MIQLITLKINANGTSLFFVFSKFIRKGHLNLYYLHIISDICILDKSKTHNKTDFKNLDLSQNLGNIMVPSVPDFGYEEMIDFSDDGM